MNEPRGARDRRRQRRAGAAGTAAGGLVLLVLAATPAGDALVSICQRAAGVLPGLLRPVAAAGLFLAAGVLAVEVAAAAGARALAGTIGDSSRIAGSTAGWWRALIAGYVVAGAGAVAVGASAAAGPIWWLPAAVGLSAALMLALVLAPAMVARWGRTRPLARRRLAASLADLAERAGVPVAGIEELTRGEWRTPAFVGGVGRSRRVFLAPEVARDWTDDEVAVVVAHELAHHAFHDLWRAVALHAVVIAAGLRAADLALSRVPGLLRPGGPADPAALPAIALAVGLVWLATAPIRHAQSRRHERRADRFALQVTGRPDAFGRAVRRLSARQGAEERPTAITRWLHFRHPPVAERLALAGEDRAGVSGADRR